MTNQYLRAIEHVLKYGVTREDRTGTGTREVFGYQNRYDLSKGFPLLTTKDMEALFNKIYHELMWFIEGETNIKYLLDRNVNIWNADAYRWFKENHGHEYPQMTKKHFIECIKTDTKFAYKYGDLGRIYGKQWTDFVGHVESRMYDMGMFGSRVEDEYIYGINQLDEVIKEIKSNPKSRRLIVSAWNPYDMPTMALPPCHVLMQFYVTNDGKLSCHLYQRSADLFLGVPFNIASYALLVNLIAHICELDVGDFIHTFGCLHIYNNHLEQITTQLLREPKPLPTLYVNLEGRKIDKLTDFKFEDLELSGYQSHGVLKGDVSVG